MLNPLETSILQTTIAALDASALLRLKSSLSTHLDKIEDPLPTKTLSEVEVITSPKYREQFINHIANGGDCRNFKETVSQ